jgi:hypothetical protein
LPNSPPRLQENGLVKFIIPDGERAQSLPDGCSIEFDDVEGMYATSDAAFAQHSLSLNQAGAWKTFRKPGDPVNTLRVGDTRGFSEYMGGGVFTERKQPTEVEHPPRPSPAFVR